MAARKKKKVAKRTAKTSRRSVKKAVSRKAASRKTAPRKAKKAKRTASATRAAPARSATRKKTKAKKSLISQAVSGVTKLLKGATKKAPNREFGEGNYKASKRFREDQEDFVKKNKSNIPALGKAAEDALEGPEGDELRAAEASAASHAAGQPTDE